MVDANRIIITDQTIRIRFDYPCDETEFEFNNPNGFTNWKLYKAINTGYKRIYRNQEKYGVWGHGIEDLIIDGIKYDPEKQLVTLDVGS